MGPMPPSLKDHGMSASQDTRMTSGSLPARIFSGSMWSVLAEVSVGGVRALSYLVYARLLSPTDFGMIGLCTLLTSLFPLLIDSSLAMAVARLDRDDQRALSVIFILNVGLSILAALALCVCAGLAADLVHDQRVAFLLPILSIQLLFNSLCSTHIALARRQFRYRRLMPVRLISMLCSLAIGLPLAFLGYTYWSLVVGTLVAALSQMAAAWILLPWRPSFEFDKTIARGVLNFTSWVAVDMGVTWLVISGGGFFLAFFLGAHDLGLFRLSDQIDTYLLGAVLSPLIPVFYNAFCEISNAREAWSRLFIRSTRAVAIVAIAVTGGIVILGNPLESMIGARWRGIGEIIVLNAIADGLSYTTLLTPSLMRAQGRAKTVAAMRMLMIAGQVAVYSLVVPFGLRAFVLGKLGLEIAMYVLSYSVLRVTFSLPVLRLIRGQIFPALVLAAGTLAGLEVASKAASLGGATSLALGWMTFGILIGCYLIVDRRPMLRLAEQLNHLRSR